MAIVPFLAMTAAEMKQAPSLPPNTAWMACHFSPYATGLSNLPPSLPEGSMLILNDRTPIHGHDPQQITGILQDTIDTLGCSGLLLDLQRTDSPQTAQLVRCLSEKIKCPVGISAPYALDGFPVFLPPIPPYTRPEVFLAPWQGWDIWLDASAEGSLIRITKQGTTYGALSGGDSGSHADSLLHCHYSIRTHEDAVEFRLARTPEDLMSLFADAEKFGVTKVIGLYQDLHGLMGI